ncbi:Protein CBG13856 [Caenorhabditis briggsae]|uniref:Protein CBG13856 n=1 Tax=Caenorhabditis briggsae TaxID=6238 RepID=A8XIV4_CAEBR|nr:Protein CBG13856 [Caenorhabditis briggsae]CAP32579.2 Protein CBG13856 [Caenorhabditis briggsae]
MNRKSNKKHNDIQFQFLELKESSLTTSSDLLERNGGDELDSTMFYLDSIDMKRYKGGSIGDLTCLDRFVKNVNPYKKFYLRQLPILISMTNKEPRFFLEEVIEMIAVLLRKSSNSEGLEILGKYEDEVLASSPNETLPRVVTLTEVNKLFEDFDIDKGLVTITPDVVYSKITDCRQGYIEQLQFFDCLGGRFVYPTQAIYIIFNECVLGLNWTTNTCNKHLNCMEKCRKKVMEFMNKYTSSSVSMNLIPLETVLMEIKELKEEECYFHQQVDINDVLNLGVTNGYNPLDFYKRIINLFHLPKNGPLTELHCAPIQGITLSFMLGWIIQFIGPIDKDNELLANLLVSNMEFAIEKDIEKTVVFMINEVVVRGKEGTRRIFKPYGAQEETHVQSKYEKMAEKARLRKLAVQQKKNKKGGKQNPVTEIDEVHGAQDSQWKDLSDEPIEFKEFKSTEDIRLSTVIVKGHRYGSNYSLLKNGPRKENPQKFFFIDIDEWQKLIDMESMMGFEWAKDEDYLENLDSFVQMTGIKTFVIRRLQEDYKSAEDSGRFFQFEEAVEIASISLILKGDDPNKHGMLEFLKADLQGLNKHVRRSRSKDGMEALFLINGIEKSSITLIPDFVEKLSQIHAKENIYTPITTIGRKGEDLMNMGESALYIFKNLICGVDWLAAVMTNGIDAYEDFQQTFENTLKPLFCEWETSYVARDWHDEVITKLKSHKIFENQPRADLNFFEGFSKGSLVPMSYFSDQCEANGLPPMPRMLLSDEMLVDEAKVLMMIVWACQFYPDRQRSREQGDRAMQRGVIMNAMSARLPQEAKLHNHLVRFEKTLFLFPKTLESSAAGENLITHWSEPGRMQSQRTADENIEMLKEMFLNAPRLFHSTMSAEESAKTSDSLFENLKSSGGRALKAFESQKGSLEKRNNAQEPNKGVKDNSKKQFSKMSKDVPENSTSEGPGSTTPRQRKSKTTTISKQSSRSSSTSTSEACSSQTLVPEGLEKNHGLLDEKTMDRNKKQRKEKKNARGDEAPDASAESRAESKDAPAQLSDPSQSVLENAKSSSGKIPKQSKHREGSLDKTEKAKGPDKEVEANSKKTFSKQSKGIPESSKNEAPGSSTSLQEKSKTSAISKESSRSPSTSISEPCSSQSTFPEGEILKKIRGGFDGETMMKKKFPILDNSEYRVVGNNFMEKIEHQIKGLMDQVKQLSEENETLKSSIEERKEEDSNELKKARKELEKEKEKWVCKIKKDLIEAGEQRDVANEKLRKADEELRDQTANWTPRPVNFRSRNLEQQLKEANKALTTMNKEKDRAVERVVREWTERWNVERHQVQLSLEKYNFDSRTAEAESKVRQLMKEKVKLLEKNPQDGSNLPAHVATYKEDIKKLRQLLKKKEDLIPHLQKRIQELSNQPGPSSQISEDSNGYLERLQNMLEIINRDDSIEEKRVRISRLLTNTDSAETRSLCVLEEDLFDSSVTMYRDTLNYNIYKVQQTQRAEDCQPIPCYPDLSQRFLDAENKERTKAMFGEGDCAICYEKIDDHEEKRTCPNEICSLNYHENCILKSIETRSLCPYCKTPYFNAEDFPVLS